MGPIKEYKKMQWGFVPVELENNQLLISFKIVEHQEGLLNYSFVFNEGSYDKIVGFRLNDHKNARPPYEYFSSR